MSIKRLFAITTLIISTSVLSVVEVYQFDNQAQEQQYYQLIEEFRCPKCQNQNLANSNSSIANDLKRKTYQQVKAGKSNEQIRHYMISRYGDFISYNPPIRPTTYILWFLPPIVLVVAILFWLKLSRQNKKIINQKPLKSNSKERVGEIKFSKKDLIKVFMVSGIMAIGFYFLVDNRMAVLQSWQTQQKFAPIAEKLLTGQINQPPQWAISTAKNQQALITAMQANVQQNADDAQRWERLAEVFLSMNSRKSALQAMERAYRLQPNNADIATTYAKISYNENNNRLSDKAEKMLKNLLMVQPDNHRATMLLIMNETNKGNPQGAIVWAKKLKSALSEKSGNEQAIASLEKLIQSIEQK
ncbi:MAG: cytochrome c-type biogenesis protein CcmH [Moraxellaceae bacterium]|nr:cytochrome c-type biogenesis protein CcmH [Moraxellaceae bacterium]